MREVIDVEEHHRFHKNCGMKRTHHLITNVKEHNMVIVGDEPKSALSWYYGMVEKE